MRECGRCHEEKPTEDFAWRRQARGQLDNYCRPCRAASNQEHYRANRRRYIEQAGVRKKAPVAERFKYLVAYLGEHPCVDCGEKDPIVLEFDHLRDTKFSIPRGFKIETGRASPTRWQSARSFRQTVTGAAPLVGVASPVRR